jgi:hypothetical protein
MTELTRPSMTAEELVALALHLRMHGENAPGGNETWRLWDREAEDFLRQRHCDAYGHDPAGHCCPSQRGSERLSLDSKQASNDPAGKASS